MEILYDNLVFELQNAGGISAYWYELSSRFMHEVGTDIFFFEGGGAKDNIFRRMLNIKAEDIIRQKSSGFYRFKKISIPSTFRKPLFHSSYYRVPVDKQKCYNVTTVHDFTHHLYYRGPRAWIHNSLKARAIRQADAVIVVSENTRSDLLNLYPEINSSKVSVVHNGVSDAFCKISNRYLLYKEDFFLFVGSREGYKNFNFAVAFTAKKKGISLFIVGTQLTFHEAKLLEEKLAGRYKHFKNISSEKLNTLYNSALCLLYLSFYEGFGIPLLEAMRAGCPFIALRNSSIPEVAGNAGYLINNLLIEEVDEAFERIQSNKIDIIEKGFEQSKKFSWDKCFTQTREVYKRLYD